MKKMGFFAALAVVMLSVGVANATPVDNGSWGNDVVVDFNELIININPNHSFVQEVSLHGGWFLLNDLATSISMSATASTWDSKPWDMLYIGISAVNPGEFDTTDFVANATEIWSGISWSDMTIESASFSDEWVTGIDYNPGQPLWGFALWDTQSQRYSDDKFGSWGTVAFTETAPVPEPATMLLFGTGLAGLAGGVMRRKKK
jgi:hypothetical protein